MGPAAHRVPNSLDAVSVLRQSAHTKLSRESYARWPQLQRAKSNIFASPNIRPSFDQLSVGPQHILMPHFRSQLFIMVR